MRIPDYQEEGLLEIPIHHDILHEHPEGLDIHDCLTCKLIKSTKGVVKWMYQTRWTEEQHFNFQRKYLAKYGHPCQRASLTGLRAGIDGYGVLGVDHDHPRPSINENLKFYRDRDTWINFTPSNHWDDIFLAPRRYMISELVKAGILGSLCTMKVNLPKHDILWWVPHSERVAGMRGGQAYFAHEPTTVNGHAYFWLDERKMNNGSLQIRRLDL